MTYADGILLDGDFGDGMQGMINPLMERCKERDPGVPDEGIGVALIMSNEGTNVDQGL